MHFQAAITLGPIIDNIQIHSILVRKRAQQQASLLKCRGQLRHELFSLAGAQERPSTVKGGDENCQRVRKVVWVAVVEAGRVDGYQVELLQRGSSCTSMRLLLRATIQSSIRGAEALYPTLRFKDISSTVHFLRLVLCNVLRDQNQRFATSQLPRGGCKCTVLGGTSPHGLYAMHQCALHLWRAPPQ